jgi:hypothetical protein
MRTNKATLTLTMNDSWHKQKVLLFYFYGQYHNRECPWSAKANGREPKSCLGRVFNFNLGHFVLHAIAWHIKKHALA